MMFERVSINLSSGIGDALMATPVIEALRNSSPNVVMDLIVSPATKGLFENDSRIHRLMVLPNRPAPGEMLRLMMLLRRSRYDAIVNCIPSNTIRQIILARSSGSPLRVKHRTPHRGLRDLDMLFTHIDPIQSGRHRVDCNLDLLRHVGIETENLDRSLHIQLNDAERRSASIKLEQKGYRKDKLTIGFHPGCNPGAAFKRWPVERYAKLGDYLSNEYGAQIVIVGGSDELDDVSKIRSQMKSPPIVLAGQCSLMETAAVIEHCGFFVSNDSGIMHLSTAVSVPTFAIFGPKDERHVGPYGPNHTVIRNGQDVTAVTVDQVIATVETSPFGVRKGRNSNRNSL